jgi:uncharacterized protein (TIGR03435 family)
MNEDMALVREFAATQSEQAFETLVSRYVNLVHSAALRRTDDAHLAEEITQATFIILARKAGTLSEDTILSGWLWRTAQFAAADALKIQRRRQRREQEAYMRSTLEDSRTEATWNEFSPLLDEAMLKLRQTDRDALMLRYFESKSLREVGVALGLEERAAQKRVNRALEKLRFLFAKRGVRSTAAIIAGAISANSIQAAPAALTKAITTVAATHGATASSSTLTVIKGALKLMAWTKAKTAIAVGVGALLITGTTTVGIKEYESHRTYSWQLPNFEPVPVMAPQVLAKTPPQVRILASKYDHFVVGFSQGDASAFINGAWVPYSTNASVCIGVGVNADSIVRDAYKADALRTLFVSELPKGRFDYIANLPEGALKVLQSEIQKKFGLVGKWQPVETNVLVLRLANPDAHGFKPANSLRLSLGKTDLSPADLASAGSKSARTSAGLVDTRFNTALDFFVRNLEQNLDSLIVDETGLTNRYDFVFTWQDRRTADQEAWKQIMGRALHDQLGVELVPARRPVEMLVVEKVK